jgi:hypothetical protein
MSDFDYDGGPLSLSEIRNLENSEIENNVNWMLSCFEVQIKENILSVLFEEKITKKKHQI